MPRPIALPTTPSASEACTIAGKMLTRSNLIRPAGSALIRFEQPLGRVHINHAVRGIDVHANVIHERYQYLAALPLDDEVASVDRSVDRHHFPDALSRGPDLAA